MNNAKTNDLIHAVRNALTEEMRGKYSDEVIRCWLEPTRMGTIDRPDGYACVKRDCGDQMAFSFMVKDDRISDVRFQTNGCINAIAAGNSGAEMAMGKTVGEAMVITGRDILNVLGGLPEESLHCAEHTVETLRQALRNYLEFKNIPWRYDR
ncbi:MAG: iron-sulfur cluster assembly scaffold protein [Syntrophales bacterium]|jgi:nitrogen fixation NifU-like protein|nr:iron-sulfur cluster assembly scaffold protein [Syntrophales bacterium]NLN59614.1 iron-sulfur cluster assembly scaffold protein [Deltaproteobacteria bacterium]